MKTEREYYYRRVMPKVRQAISDFINEMGAEGRDIRLQALRERREGLQGLLNDRIASYRKHAHSDFLTRAIVGNSIPDLEANILKLDRKIKTLLSDRPEKTAKLTAASMERAREYPIEEIIPVRRGMARCPFHPDRRPSMSVKNNRYKCFSCGARGDAIDLAMQMDGLQFREAVKRLAR